MNNPIPIEADKELSGILSKHGILPPHDPLLEALLAWRDKAVVVELKSIYKDGKSYHVSTVDVIKNRLSQLGAKDERTN